MNKMIQNRRGPLPPVEQSEVSRGSKEIIFSHKTIIYVKSIVLSIQESYEVLFPDPTFDGIVEAVLRTSTVRSEIEWLFDVKRTPTGD